MTLNPYRGEAPIQIGGETRKLFYGWEGLAMLRAELGEDFGDRISSSLALLDLKVLAIAIAIGLRESVPGITAAEVERLSPPIAAASGAVSLALQRTFYGEQGAPDDPEPNPLRRLMRAAIDKISFWKGSRPHSLPA